jgi:hypothetical protein
MRLTNWIGLVLAGGLAISPAALKSQSKTENAK